MSVNEMPVAPGLKSSQVLCLGSTAINSGKPLADLMSQVNHPNRHGHDLVVAELMKWFRAT